MEQLEITFTVTRDKNGCCFFTNKEAGWIVLDEVGAYLRNAYDREHGSHQEIDPLELEHDRMCDHADECRKAQNERG